MKKGFAANLEEETKKNTDFRKSTVYRKIQSAGLDVPQTKRRHR